MQSRSLRVISLLALVVSLSVHVTVASAVQGTAELRAIACCDAGCDHPAAGAAARCCSVERESQVPKAPVSTALLPVAWVATTVLVPALDESGGLAAGVHTDPPRSHGAPLFLLTRTLRI